MKKLMFTSIAISLLTSSISFAAFSKAPNVVCTPTVEYGNMNFSDSKTGLNRIQGIDVYANESGEIKLSLKGTSGADKKSASASYILKPISSYENLRTYGNYEKSSVVRDESNPYIQFEIEIAFDKVDDEKIIESLASLTYVAVQAPNFKLITSRYICQFH